MNDSPILLFGGPSGERRVSVASAQNVLASGHAEGIEFEPWFVSVDLKVYIVGSKTVLAHQHPFETEFTPDTGGRAVELALDSIFGPRVVFVCLHGTWGEDGTVQRLLEERYIRFTSSNSEACATAFDKAKAKNLMEKEGWKVPRKIPLDKRLPLVDQISAQFSARGPLVLKPIEGGSSIGLHLIRNADDIETLRNGFQEMNARARSGANAVGGSATNESEDSALDFDSYMMEELVSGREFTVGVVDGPDGPQSLPISEVRTQVGASFDYQGKYLGLGSTEITPADIPTSTAWELGKMALAAHKAVGARGCSRTDVIFSDEGPVFLEINTHPGLSRASFIPQQLAAAGKNFGAFIRDQIENASR